MSSYIAEIDRIGLNTVKHTSDICKSYREESRKKDEIIQEICKISSSHPCKVDFSGVVNNTSKQANYSEIAIMQVKIDRLEDKLRSKQNEIDALVDKNTVLRKEKDIYRMESEKLEKENRQLVSTKTSLESNVETYESLKYRSEYSIKVLQDQYQTSQNRVAELEARIKNHLGDREKLDQDKSCIYTKYQNLLMNLSKLVMVDDFTDADNILDKLRTMSEQNSLLNGKVQSAEQKVAAAEEEAKNSRETIVKLMRDYEGVGTGRENLREARDKLTSENKDLLNQVELQKNRIESLQKLYDDSKAEIEDKIAKLLELEIKLKEKEFEVESKATCSRSLLDCLAAMLSTPFIPCLATEGAVKDRVEQVTKKLKDQTAAAETMDQRIQLLQKQFESQYETGKQILDKSRDSENIKLDLENKIKTLENDLEARDILRDNIKCEKDRISRHIFNLAELLQIDYLPSETDVIELIDLLNERCRELLPSKTWKCPRCAQNEHGRGGNADSQKHASRVASLQEQLEAKQLQIQLLERRLEHKPDLPVCGGNESLLDDQVHRLRHQLDCAHGEIEELRRALLHKQSGSGDHQSQCIQDKLEKQADQLDQLACTIEKLDKVRQKQAKKIQQLKNQLAEQMQHNQNHEKHQSNDIKQARHLLEETRRREVELVMLRDWIAQLLGVDVRCSRDANEELRQKLQQLLYMARSSTTTPFTPYYLNQSLDQSNNFHSGYKSIDIGDSKPQETGNFSKRAQLPKSKIGFKFPKSATPQSQKESISRRSNHPRARSTSPGKIDERKY